MWNDRTKDFSCRSRNVQHPIYRVAYKNPDGSFHLSKNINVSSTSNNSGSHCNILYKTMFGSLEAYQQVKQDRHDSIKLFILEHEQDKTYMVLILVSHTTWQKYNKQWKATWFEESTDYDRDILQILRKHRKRQLQKHDLKSIAQGTLAVGIGAALGVSGRNLARETLEMRRYENTHRDSTQADENEHKTDDSKDDKEAPEDTLETDSTEQKEDGRTNGN
jgi:hypothetical protein